MPTAGKGVDQMKTPQERIATSRQLLLGGVYAAADDGHHFRASRCEPVTKFGKSQVCLV